MFDGFCSPICCFEQQNASSFPAFVYILSDLINKSKNIVRALRRA
ncbi:hypothetical protein HMPREF1582_01382 [Gardnerella vaginalis JCP8151A]|nr:hypothetical protein HMPREF1582_01382 [Gardnerella vaginalis JCP8151A]